MKVAGLLTVHYEGSGVIDLFTMKVAGLLTCSLWRLLTCSLWSLLTCLLWRQWGYWPVHYEGSGVIDLFTMKVIDLSFMKVAGLLTCSVMIWPTHLKLKFDCLHCSISLLYYCPYFSLLSGVCHLTTTSRSTAQKDLEVYVDKLFSRGQLNQFKEL